MRVLLTGGGTGGHIYPAIAIAEALRAEPALAPLEFLFVGTRRGLEAQIVPKARLPIAFVRAAPLERGLSLSILRTVFDNVTGYLQALTIVRRFRPDLAIATGGYVTFSVIAAAWTLRLVRLCHLRIALLELNVRPGLANRLLRPLVDEVWLALARAGERLGRKVQLTGVPVRPSFAEAISTGTARDALDLDLHKTTVVVFGGSQGARSLNEAVVALATANVPPAWQVLLVAGDRDYEGIASRVRTGGSANVRVVRYLDDPRVAFAAADLIVARAGASTLAELTATATPALLVPYPHATGDHQAENAEVVRLSGAARILADRDLNERRLRAELEAALEPATLQAMRLAAEGRAKSDARAAIVARVKMLASQKAATP